MVGTMTACESTAAIVVHARLVSEKYPVRPTGHSNRPKALCSAEIAWDRECPVSENTITCRTCRVALGYPEMMRRAR